MARLAGARVAVFALGAALLLSGCTDVKPDASSSPSPSETPVVEINSDVLEIEVDLFSGRENPTFTIQANEAFWVHAYFAQPGPPGILQEPPSYLGFRGFLIQWEEEGNGTDLAAIHVTPEGFYFLYDNAPTVFVEDPDPFGYIYSLAEKYLDPDVAALLDPLEEE